MAGTWDLPASGQTGYIKQIATILVLGVMNDGNVAGTKVTLEISTNRPGQQWERSADCQYGYFTLRNPNSGKFLTGRSALTLKIEGKKDSG